jgi:hypothetical protein
MTRPRRGNGALRRTDPSAEDLAADLQRTRLDADGLAAGARLVDDSRESFSRSPEKLHSKRPTPTAISTNLRTKVVAANPHLYIRKTGLLEGCPRQEITKMKTLMHSFSKPVSSSVQGSSVAERRLSLKTTELWTCRVC